MNASSVQSHASSAQQLGARTRPLSVRRLLVRGPNWIGDAVMSEPALAAVRRLFPKAEISVLVKPAIADLFEKHPAIDRLLLYDGRRQHAGLIGKWRLASSLRRAGFDMAILFQNAFEAALLAFLAGIPTRYGYATDGRGLLLTDPVPRPDRRRKLHLVNYYLELLRPLGEDGMPAQPRLYLSPSEEAQGQALLKANGIGPSDRVVGINPGSSYGTAKRWLPERFAQTADRLIQRMRDQDQRAHAVLFGASGEEALAAAIAGGMRHPPLVLSGKTSMKELMAVIKRCTVFLTNDTGPMHIAAAFGVPVVAVFGPTDSSETSPVGEHTIVRHPVDCSPCLLRECPIDHRCMTGVTVDDVHEAALRQLQHVGKSQVSKFESSDLQTLELSNLKTPLAGVTVFLDRDGTLNVDQGYVMTPEELKLHDGAAEAVASLKAQGAKVILITNQSAIGRGLLTESDLHTIHARLLSLLQAAGGGLDAVYFCPHHPEDGCRCRKPNPGLVERAVNELGVDLSAAYMVGDQKRDVELARRVGARSILVLTGPIGVEALKTMQAGGDLPDRVAPTLSEAVTWILADVAQRTSTRVIK
jgi:heptosyltransferase-2